MRLKYWEWIYALSFCCFQFQLIAVAQITDPAEVSALMAIKSNLVDPLKHLKNWNKGDPCVSNWTGVLCFDAVRTDGYLHVRELQLLNMNLSGTLAPELGQFSQLEILDFMWNDLRGSIPKEIGNIASLKLIHLNNNSLSGQIPPQLSNLSTLLHMLLDNNNLTGYLPPEFSNFPELRILQLDNNNFSGAEIPTSYGSLSALVKLSLRNCSLEGAVPDLSGIANLSYLDLSQNQLSGYIPSNPLSPSMTTIELSNNQLNGSIPDSYSDLPSLQKLSLKNNNLTGSVAAKIWQNKSFGAKAQLLLDLQNNSLSNITGNLNPLENVILRLQGNPICSTSNIRNKDQICGPEAGGDDIAQKSTNSTMICPIHACPIDNNFEYVPASPLPCFCASPLRIGYRLKSPSFSYFAPYVYQFEMYLTRSLNLDLYQLSIESFVWEKGPRLGMYLKLFPLERNLHSSIFNTTEIIRIRDIFTSWKFPGSDLFGPYELLNFTLGPYSFVNHETQVKNISKGILIAIVLPAIAVAATISALLTLFIARRKARNRHTLSRKHFSSKLYIKIDGVKSFSFREMELATDHFDSSTQVGQGGYGNVYRGILADDTIVAIKRAKEGSLQGQKEFLTEIEMLSRLHHRNLVSLVGYCDEEGEQMLVYEFMTNGSLQDWLSAKSKGTLNFGVRLQVALGSAKGILYLHTEVHPPIFHRDIKASNILLDSKLTAKVSDFGLSQLAPVMDDEGTEPVNVSTIVKGTPGYLDPEYLLTRKVTDKSDVYSLGVVFLEILTGMRPISHGKNIVREVNLAHESGTMFAVIDSRMGSYPSECVERFVALALRCCQDKPEQRPSMLDVVRELENILRMMPETGLDLSVSESSYFGESTPSSSLAFVSRDPVSSSNMLGSDLVSGSIPSIIPR
ncbi:probable LRR receptor-like serine/threonine-protein kinase At1g06840 isoform X3 [Rhododendron vialii]|uniref:probable LRR receptor-like serine/threonine-protein kinase At1g06840 isoform X3 n=1 Tax=Rhododendron vialii TaxID=182163 RepID=UPI00265E0C83|nr:probable LRR receptor-like serine/threonine-protein kinase At1g06840 isoform X3 [Rhododendron vialii]